MRSQSSAGASPHTLGETPLGGPGRPDVVGLPAQPAAGSAVHLPQALASRHNRCVGCGVGCICTQRSDLRGVDTGAEKVAHKQEGTARGPPGASKVGDVGAKSNGPGLDGQSHGRLLRVQTRGDQVYLIDATSKEYFSDCKRVKCLALSSLHTGGPQCYRGHALSPGAGAENGVDAVPRSLSMGPQGQPCGGPRGGPLREQSHDSTTEVRLPVPRPGGGVGGRTKLGLAGQRALRLSTDVHNGESCGKNPKGEATRPPVASQPVPEDFLVPLPDEVGAHGTHVPQGDVTVTPTALPTPPPKPRHSVFGAVQHQLPRLEQGGYSPRVVAHLQRARAGTTNDNYESKWKLFAGFAQGKFDPHAATPSQLAEFLTYLFDTRGVSPGTIKGYRAAIGHVLRLASGYDPGEDDIIRILMKSFDRQKPATISRVPTWDLPLVLDQWNTTCNDELTLGLLQTKAIFLLALATGARRGELWALTREVSFPEDGCSPMVLPFDKNFTFKTQFTTKNQKFPSHLTVMPLGDPQATRLCPVATLRSFLLRSNSIRLPSQTSLFIPTREGAVHTTKQLISANVVKAITWAYKQAGRAPPRGVRAHDVRGVATSLALTAGCGLEDVLRAGHWSNPHTFFKHYQKAFEPLTLQRLKHVPHVACAGRIIETGVF